MDSAEKLKSHLTRGVRILPARPLYLLAILMLCAYILRLLLAINGSQFYWPDESRYWESVDVVENVIDGNLRAAVRGLVQYRMHHGFTTVGTVPALMHRLLIALVPDDNLVWFHPANNLIRDFRFLALVVAIPSVMSIGMIFLVARQAGAPDREALLAAFLMAASNAMYIYSTQLLPYDTAMLVGLIAIYFSLRFRSGRLSESLAVGFLIATMFWIYHGYVILAVTIALMYCILLSKGMRDTIRRAVGLAGGGILLYAPIILINLHFVRENIFLEVLANAASVIQGRYAEGAILPFMYFIDTEGFVALVWLAGLILAARQLWHQRSISLRSRAILWITCLGLLYILMALLSTGLHIFVMYGRVARSLVPFVVLLCAYGFSPYLEKSGLAAKLLFVGGSVVLVASNFLPAIQQEFYMQVARQILEEYEDVSFETTFVEPAGPFLFIMPEVPNARYKLTNASFYYPVTEMTDTPEGDVIIEVSHPFNFRPWQYEGMTAEMREIVNRNGVFIRLIDTMAPHEN